MYSLGRIIGPRGGQFGGNRGVEFGQGGVDKAALGGDD